MSDNWEARLSSEEKKFKVFFEDWMNRPLKLLVDSAVKSEGGIAFDAMRSNGVRKGILICVVPKNETLRAMDMVAKPQKDIRSFTYDDLDGMNYYTLLEPCFGSPLTYVGVLEKPEAIIYAALDEKQISKIVEMFNIDEAVSNVYGSLYSPPHESHV
jgi:hypothetical protein